MPTYQNVTSNPIFINNTLFSPLVEVEVEFYTDNPNLKLVDQNPIWSPVVYSEQVGSGSVKITENLTPSVTLVRIAAKSATAVVSFNDSNSPKVLVTQNECIYIRPVSRISEVFIHEGTVSVELWREFSWR